MILYVMRAISTVLTVVYLTAAIGSCSIKNPVEESVNIPVKDIPITDDSDLTVVYLLSSLPEVSLELQQAVEIYADTVEAAVQINITTVADRIDYRSALRSRLLAGEKTDLYHLLDTSDMTALEPYLEDLSDLVWASDSLIPPLSEEQMRFGLPYSVQGVGLVANKTMFETANISLNEISDFESLSNAFIEFQQQINSGALNEDFPKLEAVTAIPAQSTEYLALYMADLLLVDSFSSGLQAYYSSSVNLPEAEGAKLFVDMLANASINRSDWKDLLNVTPNQLVETGLATGRIAAALYDTDVFRQIAEVNPDLEMSLVLLPVFYEDWEQGTIFAGSPAYWAVNSQSEDRVKKQACDFLTWLYTATEGATFTAERLRVASPYPEAAMDTGIPLHKQLLDYLEIGQVHPRVYAETPSGWNEGVFAAQLQEYFSVRSKSWDDVVQACKEEW